MDAIRGVASLPSSSDKSCSSQAPSTRDSSPVSNNDLFLKGATGMEQYRASHGLQSNNYNHYGRFSERPQYPLQQQQHTFRTYYSGAAAAPRSVLSPNWRATPAGELGPWVPAASNYMLTTPCRSRGEVVEGMLGGYAYCLDRGNGQFTRLIPADMLPALNEIPPRQTGPGGMVVLPALPTPPPQGIAEMNRPVTLKAFNNEPMQVSDTVQKQIDRIVATSPAPQKKTKVYCDKWVHEGVCAFTQQGCKYKHEMPFDKATQHSLGLFHGFPNWWKKHQAEIQRQREFGDPLLSPMREGPFLGYNVRANGQGVAMLHQQNWRRENGTKARNSTHTPISSNDGGLKQTALRPLSSGPTARCVWGPIEPPHKSGSDPNAMAISATPKRYIRGVGEGEF